MAINEKERVVAEINLDTGKNHSETILTTLDMLYRCTGLGLKDMDLLACTVGPGSFTGLRIGVSTVKAFALATGKPLVGISTLAALSLNGGDRASLICPMIDAKRGQVFWGLYRRNRDGTVTNVLPDRLSDVNTMLNGLRGPVVFLGDGALLFRSVVEDVYGPDCIIRDVSFHHVKAAKVGLLAAAKYGETGGEEVLTFAPRYFRPSSAEERP